MKIGLISDLHTDISQANRKTVKYLISAAKDFQLDLLVIAGDVSPKLMELAKTLIAFRKLDCPKLFIAGNHDIWVIKDDEVTSKDKYELISRICEECGFHNLDDSPFILDGVGFCGTIGWYDYSFRPKYYDIPEEKYKLKYFRGSVWNDVNYAKWNCSDIELTQWFKNKLKGQIRSIEDNTSQIVVVTHHVPFREGIIYQGEIEQDFFNAFMGSKVFGEICVNEPSVTHAFFGHSHRPFDKKIRDVRVVCSPIGYLYDVQESELENYARKRLTTINL